MCALFCCRSAISWFLALMCSGFVVVGGRVCIRVGSWVFCVGSWVRLGASGFGVSNCVGLLGACALGWGGYFWMVIFVAF